MSDNDSNLYSKDNFDENIELYYIVDKVIDFSQYIVNSTDKHYQDLKCGKY